MANVKVTPKRYYLELNEEEFNSILLSIDAVNHDLIVANANQNRIKILDKDNLFSLYCYLKSCSDL